MPTISDELQLDVELVLDRKSKEHDNIAHKKENVKHNGDFELLI